MSLADEIQKLQQLHQSGAIDAEEFAQAKKKLLDSAGSSGYSVPNTFGYTGTESLAEQTQQWAMFIHLSQFAGFLVPFAGFVLPIVLWQMKKECLPGVDVHGKIVTNWIVSALIYGVISGVLCFLMIGFLFIAILAVLGIVYPIIGAIKANNGEAWPYPLSIRFFK